MFAEAEQSSRVTRQRNKILTRFFGDLYRSTRGLKKIAQRRRQRRPFQGPTPHHSAYCSVPLQGGQLGPPLTRRTVNTP